MLKKSGLKNQQHWI